MLSQILGYFVPVLNVNSGCELWEGGLVFCGDSKDNPSINCMDIFENQKPQ